MHLCKGKLVLFFTEQIQTSTVINIVEILMQLPRTNAQKGFFGPPEPQWHVLSLQANISEWRMPCPRKYTHVCFMASLLYDQVQAKGNWSSGNREKRYSKDIISLSSALCTEQLGLFLAAQVPWQRQLTSVPYSVAFSFTFWRRLMWKLYCRGRQGKEAISSFNCQAVENRGREGVDVDGSCPDKQ